MGGAAIRARLRFSSLLHQDHKGSSFLFSLGLRPSISPQWQTLVYLVGRPLSCLDCWYSKELVQKFQIFVYQIVLKWDIIILTGKLGVRRWACVVQSLFLSILFASAEAFPPYFTLVAELLEGRQFSECLFCKVIFTSTLSVIFLITFLRKLGGRKGDVKEIV